MNSDNEEIKNRAALYKKKNKLREMMMKCDWKKDGYMLLGGKRVDYITSEKIIRNFAPLLTQVGLELECGFDQPVRLEQFGSRGEEHWMVGFNVRYVDVDTGYMTMRNTYYGEGMDARDKALKKASTDAQKLWLLADFKIGEGIDPDAGTNDTQGAYIPKGEEENVEIKTKIAANAVKPPAPKLKKAEEAVEVPVKIETENAEELKEQIKEVAETVKEAVAAPPAPKKPVAPKKPAAPKEVPKAAPADTSAPTPGSNTEYGKSISEPQKKPLIGIYEKWAAAHTSGQVSDESFAKLTEAYINIGSNRDIVAFITKFREVKE